MGSNKKEILVQNRILKRSNKLTFLDNRTLRVDSQINNMKTSYRIDVIALRAKYKHQFSFSWPWLIGAIVLFALLIIEISTSLVFPEPGSWVAIIAKLALGLLTIVCLALFIKLSHRQYVFMSRHANVPLLTIWAGQPSRKAVKNFVQLVKQRIENAHNHMQLTEEQQLTGEMKMLRRLVEEGIVQNSIYEAARPKLLSKF